MDIQNKRIPDSEFNALRQEVLTQWPTGKDVNLEEAVAYHKAMPENRIFSLKLLKAKQDKMTLVQPRAGVPVVERHIELLQHLQDKGEADLLPTTIDSYTRQNRYTEAENGINESLRLDRAMLNGFPAVNHGVQKCRQVIESVNVPVRGAVAHLTPVCWRKLLMPAASPAMRAAVSPTTCPTARTSPWSAPSATGSTSTV